MPTPALSPPRRLSEPELAGSWRVTAALTLALSIALAPAPGLAAPASGENPADEAPAKQAPAKQAPASEEPASEEPAHELQPTVTQIETADAPSGGGVAGAIVDPDDPNATRAQSDLEGESLDTELDGVPERLPKLQSAGWWTTFTAVALATTGGILAGVAETRQDEAIRLAYGFDLETGRAMLYGSVADDYERLLNQGETYQWAARGFIIAGGVALVTGVALFAVDATRRRKAERSQTARLRLDPGPGLRLRF